MVFPHATRLLILTVTLAPAAVLSQSATPGTVLEEVTVTASRSPAMQRLDAAAGGTAIVASRDLPATTNLTLSRALAGVPGVVVQDFFGGNDQPRVQIRGSGLQQNPVERGVLMLRNGLPINRADGSYVVGFANPGAAGAVEVYRGYMANRLGATVLGGALNLISPTGHDAPGVEFGAGSGSFGQRDLSARYGHEQARFDTLLHGSFNDREGYRAYNASRHASVDGNLGMRVSDTLTVRFFASFADLAFDVAGPLTRDALERNPRRVFTGPTVTPMGAINPGPNVVRDRPYREATQWQAGARATQTLGAHIVDLAVGHALTDDQFNFPVSAGLRVTEGDDTTAVVRYAFRPDVDRALPFFEATAQFVTGTADREYYLNLAGQRGSPFGRNSLSAETITLHAGFNIPIGSQFTLSPSASWARAVRDNHDRFGLPMRPTAAFSPVNPAIALPPGAVPAVDNSYARNYEALSPAVGLAWQPFDDHTLFVAYSRSFEPPTHDDLLATVGGTPNSSAGRPNPADPTRPAAAFVAPALKAQRATTIEAGWRGRIAGLSWDAVVYRSSIDDELLSLRDAAGVPLGAANAPHTRHLGVEAGVGAQLSQTVSGRIVYSYQDFRFRRDPMRGDNHLAGAPRHWVHGTLAWRPTMRWNGEAAVRWSPAKIPVDNLNTLFNDPYATLDLRVERRFGESLTVFAEMSNVFDETWASSTLIVDQARPDQAVFLPGDGRALGFGVRLQL